MPINLYNFWRTTAIVYFALIATGNLGIAQSGYSLVGSARSLSSTGCYQLTPELDGQTGAVWFDEQLQLAESFELSFLLNFSNNPYGADGMALVFQTTGNQVIGGAGRGLGYAFIKPAFSVEFDTNYNSEEGDITADHVALGKNGIINHRLNTDFPAPVPISSLRSSVKDGRDHFVRISWNATKKLFQVDVDCVNRITQVIDLTNSIFSGNSTVFWGFTASTGSAKSAHTVCLLHEKFSKKTIQACRNDTLTLTAPLSQNNTYRWLPVTGINNPQSRTIQLTVDSSRLYTVQYIDFCNRPLLDSVFILAKTPNLSISGKQSACLGDTVKLVSILNPSFSATYKWSTGETTPQISPVSSGRYSLTVVANGCTTSATASVTFHTPPASTLPLAMTYDCPGNQPLILDPQVRGADLTYNWLSAAGNQSTLSTNAPGTYEVIISNSAHCTIRQRFTILDNCPSALIFVPDAFTPNGDGINDLLKWYGNADMEISMKLFDRWGEILFASSTTTPYWNGMYKGVPCPAGTYAWRLDGFSNLAGNHQSFTMKGKVLLVN